MPSTSYQLPDLYSLSHTFTELRTNRFCHRITLESESWLLNLNLGLNSTSNKGINSNLDSDDAKLVLDDSERTRLRGMKSGLLAALCFPTCDASQLRLITDFLSLLIFFNLRVLHCIPNSSNWNVSSANDNNLNSGVACLEGNELLRHITFRLARLVSLTHTHKDWDARFARSVNAFHAAQQQIITNRSKGAVPDLEAYIELRRDSSGVRMMFDLIELAEGLAVPDEDSDEGEAIRRLKQCAADIIAWSLDIVSFNLQQSLGDKHNLVAILRSQKGLSIQGAVNFAASLVRQTFEAFNVAENALMALWFPPPSPSTSPSPLPSNPSSSSSYKWRWRSPSPPPPRPPPTPPSRLRWNDAAIEDAQLYVQGLKDCVVGIINWVYETEIYFGVDVDAGAGKGKGKGEEVRKFGWVFLLPDNHARPLEM